MRGVGVACTVGGHDVGEGWGDLSGYDVGEGGSVYVTAGMNKHYSSKKASARRDNGRGRSCFVAMCEVEETSLGMWMTKTGGGQYASDLYSLGEIRCMGRRVEICPGHRSSCCSLNALLSPEISTADLDEFHFFFQWTELVHPSVKDHSHPKYPSTTFIVLSNLSPISPSFPIEPCLLLSQIIFPPMPLSLPPTSCLSHSPVIPGHAPRVLGPTLTSLIPTFRVWLEWASPSLKVSTSGVRQDHFVRPSCPASLWMLACSLYHPLVRTGKAEMNYIADYPAVAGSPTRLHGSSGQRYLVAKKTTTQTSVTEPKVNGPALFDARRGRDSPLDHMFRLRTLQLDYFVIHACRIFDYILSSYAFHSAHLPTHLSPRVFQITRTASDSCGSFFSLQLSKARLRESGTYAPNSADGAR